MAVTGVFRCFFYGFVTVTSAQPILSTDFAPGKENVHLCLND